MKTLIRINPSTAKFAYRLTVLLILALLSIPLFRDEGQAAPTEPTMVKDILVGADSSALGGFASMNGVLYFNATEGTNGVELWRSDGTAAGTIMVADIRTGSESSLPTNLTAVGNTLFFSANDGNSGVELWKSDGTAGNATLVKDIYTTGDSYPSDLIARNNDLFFVAEDGTHGRELWISDGSPGGTILVKDIDSLLTSTPTELTVVNGIIFFRATDGTLGGPGTELWKSDGTLGGTILVKDIAPGVDSSIPGSLTAMNNTLFFRADDGIDGSELWQSDGTEAGTSLVKDIYPGGDSFPINLAVMNNTLFFAANDGAAGTELWQSDGTTAGTMLVKNININGHSGPAELTVVGSTLFFLADDGTHGQELWKSDGTEAGTILVKDINPSGSSGPFALTGVGNTLFFAADDGSHGYELWQSDGTAAGTVMVKDIYPGSTDSFPRYLTNIGGTLFFAADDGTHGNELWAYTPPNSGICAAPLTIACGGQVSGNTTGFQNNINSYNCTAWDESGPEVIYSFNLPAGDVYTVTATLSNITVDLDVFLLDTGGCSNPGQCLGITAINDTATASNVSPGTYFVSVDGYQGVAGDYTLSLTCQGSSNNNPPNTPTNPSPSSGATAVSLAPTLSWTGGDPDGDTVYYSVSFGEINMQSSLWCTTTNTTSCTDQNANTPLKPNTTYAWQVIAEDPNLGVTSGPIWSFTTGSGTTHKIFLPMTVK